MSADSEGKGRISTKYVPTSKESEYPVNYPFEGDYLPHDLFGNYIECSGKLVVGGNSIESIILIIAPFATLWEEGRFCCCLS